MEIWSCVGLWQESVQKSPSGEVGTDYCSQWGSKQSLRCKPDRRGFKVVEGGLASGTDRDITTNPLTSPPTCTCHHSHTTHLLTSPHASAHLVWTSWPSKTRILVILWCLAALFAEIQYFRSRVFAFKNSIWKIYNNWAAKWALNSFSPHNFQMLVHMGPSILILTLLQLQLYPRLTGEHVIWAKMWGTSLLSANKAV